MEDKEKRYEQNPTIKDTLEQFHSMDFVSVVDVIKEKNKLAQNMNGTLEMDNHPR